MDILIWWIVTESYISVINQLLVVSTPHIVTKGVKSQHFDWNESFSDYFIYFMDLTFYIL